jgi:hypothetical protein
MEEEWSGAGWKSRVRSEERSFLDAGFILHRGMSGAGSEEDANRSSREAKEEFVPRARAPRNRDYENRDYLAVTILNIRMSIKACQDRRENAR